MTNIELNLHGVLSKDVPDKLAQFYADIQFVRSLSQFEEEEIFIGSEAYCIIVGCLTSPSNPPIPGLSLSKEAHSVGVFHGINLRSNIFTPAPQRDSENIPETAIVYTLKG